MHLLRSIVFSAVIAGCAVGATITVIQQFGTVPLILKAEVYEKAADKQHGAATPSEHATVGHSHSGSPAAEHQHDAETWEPRDGLERNAFTAGANVLNAIGFALILTAFLALRNGTGHRDIHWHEGLVLGLAGFAVFTLAPGLGLPPELPGVPAAPLLARQIWWVFTALATAGGLGLIFVRRTAPAAIAGLVLIILPHLIGAPELDNVETNVPTSLSHQFAVIVTMTSLVFWSLLGTLSSITFTYFDRSGAMVPSRA
jgi:cobalt transporter subunit CbtA